MIAIKDTEMPSCCTAYNSDNGKYEYISCPFYQSCKQRERIKTNYKPDNCPLVEIITCSECNNWEGNNFGTGYCSIKKKYKRSYDYCSEAQRRVDDSY